MSKITISARITKLSKQRDTLKSQVEQSKKKIDQYEAKLAQELGQLALSHQLDKLNEAELKSAFKTIALEHKLL